MKKIMIIVLLFGLSGCGLVFRNIDEQGYKNLAFDMSKEEVISIMGQPQKERTLTIEDKQYEIWEYPENEPSSNKIKTVPSSYCKLFFLEGKLVQWDKNKVIAQPYYQFIEKVETNNQPSSDSFK